MARLSGRVIEKWTNIPVSGALVTVNGVSVIADAAGNFVVDTIYASATVQVLHLHHEPLTVTVNMAGDTQIELTLTPTARGLQY